MKINVTTISSQRYLDDDTVDAKSVALDYTVTVSPSFGIDGKIFRAIINGHHSYAAAIAAGVDPVFSIATAQQDDRILLIDTNIDDFLASSYVDSDWYDVFTGKSIF